VHDDGSSARLARLAPKVQRGLLGLGRLVLGLVVEHEPRLGRVEVEVVAAHDALHAGAGQLVREAHAEHQVEEGEEQLQQQQHHPAQHVRDLPNRLSAHFYPTTFRDLSRMIFCVSR